jgi:hypothetical protein
MKSFINDRYAEPTAKDFIFLENPRNDSSGCISLYGELTHSSELRCTGPAAIL